MSQTTPFVFGGNGGQSPLIPLNQPQYNNGQPQSNDAHQQPQSAAIPQMAFQQNGQLPGMDMSALAGVSPEQLAAIARLFQAGALTLPPLPPEAPVQTPAATPALANAVPQSSTAAPLQQEDLDMDKEEGELEEGEVGDTPKARDFLRPPPTGPRNRSASPRGPKLNKPNSSPRQPLAKEQPNKSKQPQQPQSKVNGSEKPPNGHVQAGKDAAAKSFVLQMVKSGYSYGDLVKEIGNPKPLNRMFQQLGLSMSSEQPSKQDQLDGATSDPAPPHTGSSKEEEIRKTSVAKRPAPTKPVNRNEYLARLQAAKNRKADTATAQVAPAKSTDKAMATDEPEPVEAPRINGTANNTGQPVAVNKREDKTELARRRLEALKALQAAKQNGTRKVNNKISMTSPIPETGISPTENRQAVSSPTPHGLGAGIADIATKASQVASVHQLPTQTVPTTSAASTMISPPLPTPSRSFSGLPGLFMIGSPALEPDRTPTAKSTERHAQASNIPQTQSSILPPSKALLAAPATASPTQHTVPRKRPVAADFDDVSKPKSIKRPFGQSRGASEDESVIIEVSDDEDEDDQMEIIEDVTTFKPQTKSFRDMGPLRDFPSRSSLSMQASNPSTPGGVSYEQRVKEIEEMKRRIAVAEKKKITSSKAAVTKPNEGVSTSVTPSVATDISMTEPEGQSTPKASSGLLTMQTFALGSSNYTAPQANTTEHSRDPSLGRLMSANTYEGQQEKEKIRQRPLEPERDEFVDASDAVEAVVRESEPLESSAPTYTSARESLSEITPIPQERSTLVQPPSDRERSGSEEAELSDDSMSNLYDTQDAPNTAVEEALMMNGEKVGSQATTASAKSSSELPPSNTEMVPALQSHWPDSFEDDIEIDKGATAAIEPALPSGLRSLEHDAQDIGMAEPVQGSINGEDNSDNSEDEDLYEVDDLVQPPVSRSADQTNSHTGAIDANMSEDGEIEESDSASISSSEPEDDGQITANAVPQVMEEVGKDAATAAISHVTSTEPVVKNVDDTDLAPELQPAKEQLAELSEETPAKHKGYYTPYESALKSFKDYKWHQDFLSNVSGGFKSLTYNHKIDPNRPLCRFEAAGGICNDPNCPDQHFGDMALTENELLRRLGTTNLPAHTPEQIRSWNDGLSAVVKQLRATNLGRDANAIAAKISEFRRDFIGDPTKVINLG